MTAIESVVEALRKDSFVEEASEFQKLAEILFSDNKEKALKAAEAMHGLCHIRSFGDLAIKSINGWEWNSLLEKADKLVNRRIEKLSESDGTSEQAT